MSRLLTCAVILSHPHLFKAVLPKDPKPEDKPKYSAALLFDAEAWASPEAEALRAAAMKAAKDKWGDKAEAMVAEGSINLPFRKDITAKGYPAEFVRFINCSAGEDHPPQVVSAFAGTDGKPLPIVDRREVYPGCKVRVSLTVYAYEQRGNKGVSFGLGNVQKLGDGPRLDSHKAAADEFDAKPAPVASDAAALAALM